jgi:hypothetical protein
VSVARCARERLRAVASQPQVPTEILVDELLRAGDLRTSQLERGRVPAVEVTRIPAKRILAATLDIEQDLGHALRDHRIGSGRPIHPRPLEKQQVLVVENSLGDHRAVMLLATGEPCNPSLPLSNAG